jgi:predicted metal-dependent hydrolase
MNTLQFQFNFDFLQKTAGQGFLSSARGPIPIAVIRNPRARRYLLRLRPDGSARVTIPRGGSIAEGRKFAERHIPWLEKQLQQLSTRRKGPEPWVVGTSVYFRGELQTIELIDGESSGSVRLGTELIQVKDLSADLRREVETHLWNLAIAEFPGKVLEYAAIHQLKVSRITVRNQRSRWGSCSRRGTISLNWRLIQTPAFVRDYLILHELMHLRQMNHSARFWREVEAVCPGYVQAEHWLKKHSRLLL